MKILYLLAAALGQSAFANLPTMHAPFRGPTPSARKKGLINKQGLPSGYPGAKLARRALQSGITVKAHGMRQNGVTYKTKRF
jgi:hypothetical protein